MSSYDESIASSAAPPEGHKLLEELKRPWRVPAKARYEYRDLESERHIRLLHITIEEPVPLPRLEIIHVPLDSAPAFEAVSYCWGDGTQLYNIPIETNGNSDTRCIPATESLATAMVFLPRSSSTRYLWIDQVCINQQDDNERGYQIALMGEIYSTATRVLVWLGPGLGVGNDTTQNSACFAGLQPFNVDDHETDLRDLTGPDGIRDLFKNEWFQRAWVVQESSLARERRALTSRFSIRWEILMEQSMNHPASERWKVVFHCGAYFEWKKLKQESNKSRAFCGFLAKFGRRFEASDPKDKVLAFLGLWKPPDFDTKAATQNEETVADVYTRFATSLIKHTKGLDVLAAVDRGSRGRERGSTTGALPSWVPEWEYAKEWGLPPVFQFRSDTNVDAYEWDASRSRNHQYQFESPTAAELRTRGRTLWKIEGGSMCQRIKDRPCEPDQLQKTRQILGLDSGGPSIAVSDALRILFLCGVLKKAVRFSDLKPGLKGPGGIAILRQCFPDAKRDQIEGLPECDNSLDSDNGPIGTEHSDISDPNDRNGLEYACIHAFYLAKERRFFKTQQPWNVNVEGVESRIGLGPGCMQTGDEIAILHGANFPVVLRRIEGREQRYEFIGDCYVDGVMFGEAVDWEEEDADDIVLV